MKLSKTTRNLTLVAALALAGTAVAQNATPAAAPAAEAPATTTPPATNGLDLPSNLQIFGKADPNIRKPTAIVNQTVITGTDVDHRVAMIEALNNVNVEGEELTRLRLQVLRQLIDETLQIGAAKQQEISPTAAELTQNVNRILANMQRTPEQMSEYLRSKGSSIGSFRRQIEGELAWSRFQRRNIESRINVSDEEVQAILNKLKSDQGSEEYDVSEIYLAGATPEQLAQAQVNGQRIIEEIRKQTRPFGYFARNFSDATTRAVDGKLGWVRPGQLPAALASNLAQMQPGQIAGPIDVGGGYSILFLEDKRKVLTADPRDSKLDLRQLTVDFAPGTTKAQAGVLAAAFAKEIAQIKGCGDVENVARRLNAKVVTSDQNRIRDLPPQLQQIMLQLQVGQATPPFGAVDSGVRALVLCGRDDPVGGSLPDANRLRAGLEEAKVNRVAQRMLRDLRRDAVIEYK